MKRAGIRISHRLTLAACLGICLAGCTSRSYFVSEMSLDNYDEEGLLAKVSTLEPDALADKSLAERQWTLYSGKMLLSGTLIRSRKERERLEVTVRGGSIVTARRNIQMIEVRSFGCGNISGHDDFCGTEKYYQCEQWGTHHLRKSCSEVIVPTSAAAPGAAARYVQKATALTAGPPTIVRKSAGDPVGGTVAQP